jgi:hypothetical protein
MPWQVQLPVDERPPTRAGGGQEHPNWQLSTLPAVPEYWRWTRPRSCPSSSSPSRPPPAPPAVAQVLDHIDAQVVPDQIGVQSAVANNRCIHREWPPRHARPTASRSCARPSRTAPGDRPAPAGGARRGRTDPRSGHAGRPAPPPTPALPRSLVSPIDVRHGPSPSWPSALPAPSRPAGRDPTSPRAKCGWSTKPPTRGSAASWEAGPALTPPPRGAIPRSKQGNPHRHLGLGFGLGSRDPAASTD